MLSSFEKKSKEEGEDINMTLVHNKLPN